jgi:hypothetical protein
LRHELSVPTRMYTFGPAPIERHRDRSDLESFATPDEVSVQAKKTFRPRQYGCRHRGGGCRHGCKR